MDVRTPALIALCILVAALSLSVLGLAADNIAYVNDHQDGTVNLHYLRWNQTAEATYSYWVQIDYLPSRFSMTRIKAMLGASIVTVLAAIGVAVVSWVSRGDKTTEVGLNIKKQKRSVPLLPLALIFAAVAFAITFAVAVYAWYPVMKWDINFKNSLPFPTSVTGATSKSVKYESPFEVLPDLWNCWISDYTVDPNMGGRLRTLCKEATAAKILMLPVVVLSAALAVVVGLAWWKASRAAASKPQANEKDAEEVSI